MWHPIESSLWGSFWRDWERKSERFTRSGEFIEWAKENNALHVLATFPNIARNSEYKDPVVNEIERKLIEFYNSNGVPVVGTLRGTMFPEEDCYDTLYHLTSPVVERRTAELCQKISPLLIPQANNQN